MTDPDQTRPPRLSDSKLIAIDTLLTGATHREAADAAGVQRSTVTGWVNHHIGVITELGQRRHQRAKATSDLLDETISGALRLLAARIDEGDEAAAIAVLRVVDKGRLHRTPSGPAGTPLATAAQLTRALNLELLADSMLPDHLLQFVEKKSDESE